MKYFKKLKQYKASNLVYDTNSQTAWSYDWYCIAKTFDVEAPKGLECLSVTHDYYVDLIRNLEAKIANPRSRESANQYRREQLTQLLSQKMIIDNLLANQNKRVA